MTLDDFKPSARRRLARHLFGYGPAAAETGRMWQDNREALDSWRLVPKALRGVEGRLIGRGLRGKAYAAPFGIAPMGRLALMARNVIMARAAARADIPYVLSESSWIPVRRAVRSKPCGYFKA
ncbi:MAG: alpha-hydroxy-acid oxidizing protein [Paracoccus sp. (in: a-proteobacteria)]|uniref:alpha-hydroxy-acid oxidizing protein n=1 Tax=Paracoccus sp. TaxID=267 RepID=UPI004058BF2F